MERNQHIVLLTPGQPSSNPRMLKEAIAFSNAGYIVTVVYCFWAHWAHHADAIIKERYPGIQWIEVGGNPYNKRWPYLYTRIRYRLYRWLCTKFSHNLFLAERAELRAFSEMNRIAVRLNPDIYVAHNLGALAVAGRAAKKQHTAFAFDAEDFHRGQSQQHALSFKRAVQIEQYWMPKASYISAASPLIAEKYQKATGTTATVVNNVFSIKFLAPRVQVAGQPIRLFWFSQTVGRERGLEDIIKALGLLPRDSFSLTLMGDATDEVKTYFQSLMHQSAGDTNALYFLEPVEPDSVFRIAQSYDIGLALEPGRDQNNQIALSNKIFSYMLAASAIIFSATPAQQQFFQLHPTIGWIYPCGDVQALAHQLLLICSNPSDLAERKRNAWQLAKEKYNWEIEQQKLLRLIESVHKDA